jgi:hypothetical protein
MNVGGPNAGPHDKPSNDAIWLERVLAWRQDGRSASRYCEDQPYHPSSLLLSSSRLGQREGPAAEQSTKWAAKAATAAAFAGIVARPASQPHAAVVLAVGASRTQVTDGFDPCLLHAIVHALTGGGQLIPHGVEVFVVVQPIRHAR